MVENKENIPIHIAVIMDGNGRWASKRGLPRSAGHKKGAEAAKRTVKAAADLGVEYITLFGFSSENWRRPETEIKDLMQLLRYYLRSETADMHKNNVKLRVIGDRTKFDDDIIELIESAESLTVDNDGITMIMALNYGGRDDIKQAVEAVIRNPDSAKSIEEQFTSHLMTAGIPDPDILIRTSGEQRISNFLLWQCAYTEFVFTDVLWPDFGKSDLEAALAEYAGRERRYGDIKRSEG
ncbi:MAG: isoprenyl transferase [Micavibrio sp.]|nr:MAG: isoprenyl transferase [Micavibrio sp.]